jgi:diguanylate cyclase (GGDEF)-like protein
MDGHHSTHTPSDFSSDFPSLQWEPLLFEEIPFDIDPFALTEKSVSFTVPPASTLPEIPELTETAFPAGLAESLIPLPHRNWVQQELACSQALNIPVLPDVSIQETLDKIHSGLCQLLKTSNILLLGISKNANTCFILEQWQQHFEAGSIPIAIVMKEIARFLKVSPDKIVQFPLKSGSQSVGFVACVIPENTSSSAQQALLTVLAPYLAVKLQEVLGLIAQSHQQVLENALLTLSKKLVKAVNQDTILADTLECLLQSLKLPSGIYLQYQQESQVLSLQKAFTRKVQVKTAHVKPIDDVCEATGFSSALPDDNTKLPGVPCPKSMTELLNGISQSGYTLLAGSLYYKCFLPNRQPENELVIPVFSTGQAGHVFGLFVLEVPNALVAILSDNMEQHAQMDFAIASSLSLAVDAMERASLLEKALEIAACDELTGLMTRKLYYQRFESELARARRQQVPLCVALIDVDYFKQINDTYGHFSGDLVLKALARRLLEITRKSDSVCRFGGEEFALLLPDTGILDALDLMERIRADIAAMLVVDSGQNCLSVNISIGLALVDTRVSNRSQEADIEAAVAQADRQLYQAKRNGRNQVCVLLPE